jgi:glycosyltransferase involved in cell wall biosynthesis
VSAAAVPKRARARKSPAAKLGIVTISYNQAPFLREAVESVLAQDCASDYVVVDPGSTDGSRDIIRGYGSRLKAVFEADAGPADGLNKGFSAVEGDILGYINSDDRYLPDSFQWVLDFFSKNDAVDVVVGGVRIVSRSGVPRPWSAQQWNFSPLNYLDHACNNLQPGIFMRRKAFQKTWGFNVQNRVCWDTELLLDLFLSGSRVVALSETLADSRLYAESITGSGRMTEKLAKERRRLDAKIMGFGHRPTAAPKVWFKRFFFHCSLRRRLVQIVSRYTPLSKRKPSWAQSLLSSRLLRP